jgi:hypothetical protein
MKLLKATAVVLLTLCAQFVSVASAFQPQQVITGKYRQVVSAGGGGTPAVVQYAINSAAMNFGSGTVTLASAATVGNVIIVEFWQDYASTSTVTVVDNNGHSATQSAAGAQLLTCCLYGGYLYSFSYVVPASGTTTYSFSFTGSFAEAYVIEISGLASATLQAYSADVGVTTNPSPSATPTSSPSLALGVYMAQNIPTAGSGWTGLGSGVTTNGSGILWIEYKAVTGTSAQTATVSGAGSADAFAHIW